MKIVCSRQVQLGRTNERRLAFLELLSEPKIQVVSLPGELYPVVRFNYKALRKKTMFILKPNIYLEVLVKFILSDINVKAESELLILHGIGCHHSGVAASVSRGGGQLVVMVQKLLKGPQISPCVSMLQHYRILSLKVLVKVDEI